MGNFWSKLRGAPDRPSREEVVAVMHREKSEAMRQRLEAAMKKRTDEIEEMLGGVLPERGAE